MNASLVRLGALVGLATGCIGVVVACSSSKTSDTPAPLSTSTGAAVAGAPDTHCAGKPVVVVSQPACTAPASDAGKDEGGTDAGGADTSGYGPTNYGSEADDDDCKYHVKWQSSAVTQNADVTFLIAATAKIDGSPAAGAKPYAEITFDVRTPAPNTPVKTVETSPGTYTIGPVQFNKSGNWTVRFHFHDECTDSETSPHGHVAFFVKVP